MHPEIATYSIYIYTYLFILFKSLVIMGCTGVKNVVKALFSKGKSCAPRGRFGVHLGCTGVHKMAVFVVFLIEMSLL